VGPAAGRRTNARPKRLNGLFYLLDLILNASMGQIRRLGGKKARQQRIFHQTRRFNLLNFPLNASTKMVFHQISRINHHQRKRTQ